jgi:hypothetical protein
VIFYCFPFDFPLVVGILKIRNRVSGNHEIGGLNPLCHLGLVQTFRGKDLNTHIIKSNNQDFPLLEPLIPVSLAVLGNKFLLLCVKRANMQEQQND